MSGTAPRSATTAFLLALVPLLLLTWRFDFVCDDAYITFRYARNLAEGNGLVYNAGEWVEGYSEFLWALVLAAGQLVGLSPLILSRVLSVIGAVVLVRVTTRLVAERVEGAPVASHGAALFLGCLPPLGVWATGGLATMPFAATITVLFALVWRASTPAGAWKLGLAGAVAALLRADGAWWVAFTLGPAIALGLARRERALWRPALLGAALAAGAFLLHLGWRVWVYGDWLPNTARVKVGLSGAASARGASYLAHFLLTFPGLVLAAALWPLAPGRARRAGPALVLVLATFAYAVLVGGDFMAFGRFFVPALPFLALLLGTGLAALEARFGAVPAALVGLAATALVVTPAFDAHVVPKAMRTSFSVRHNRADVSRGRSEYEQWANMEYQAREWSALGKGLALASGPDDSLVYSAAGAIGWYSRLHLYDRNGLVTPSVAREPAHTEPRSPGHDKTVGWDFFAQARPTYLFAAWVPERGADWRAAVEATGDPSLVPLLRAGRLRALELPAGEHPYPGHHLVVLPGR